MKSVAKGKLRSLHQFMQDAPHELAVRLYPGPLRIDHIQHKGTKPYFLLNLPYYLGAQLPVYLPWFQEKIRGRRS
jgi:hypothetical protein